MRSLASTATTTTDTADIAKAPSSGWQTMKRTLAPYLWPKNETWVRQRVSIALFLLLVSKVISVTTPYFYKKAVDALKAINAGVNPTTPLPQRWARWH